MTIREYIRQNPILDGESNIDYFRRVAKDFGCDWSSVEKPFYSERKFERTRYTTDGKGKIKTQIFSALPQDRENTEGLKPTRITQNPYGGQWVRYEQENFSIDQAVADLYKVINREVKPYKYKKKKGGPCSMVVLSSDKHFGAHTKEHSVYNNDYSPKVFRKRHDMLLDQIWKEHKRFGVFRELVYFDLGDAADGWNNKTTRGGHHLPQNLDNVGQWREYVAEHKRAFGKLIDMNPAQEYRFIGASNSNHGGDFDYILMRTLAMYLEERYGMTTHVSQKPFDHMEVQGHSYIYGHGKDATDMKGGFPLNLNAKVENWINDYIDQKGLKGAIHFVAGDLHQSAQNYGKRFRYRRVLSMYGSSKWIHTNFGSGRPGVGYDILDGQHVYSADLFL